ncbi:MULTISPECIES: diaminopimelate decarboxylase [unclassified Rhizobacter]|uniref:diaminopimelate decarboxylase n=1 Tax=unclassified Rhizobacter TaxID=2640088 RepID=UPI0006F9C5E9|nr:MULTISPECIES: diaminopimelate decarboxylase [unclassified Rhizobacter]KQU67033.1 diaminopimelate decarboxylase [Rhizobacter sp. Root29]KQV98256.1 diaminopimelate decarboxylase [Rhizobacter sp. Root1238]KRB02154.1 diaminopimelate decarboxylase [Rhizobacter sp. Root16D2]
MTLPGSPHIAYRGDDLAIEDCALNDLADRFGTPLYVYSRSAMLAALDSYQRALAGRDHLICYAMKANSNLAVLQTFAQAGCGFDIVSGGELKRVLAAGAPASRIVFSGVGKTRAEMREALEAGVMCFNVESEPELELLSQVAVASGHTARISLRVNPDVDAGTHPYISTGLKGNKFGIAHERAVATYQRAAALPGLEVVGIDCHIGSQITEATPYLDALDRLLDLVEAVEAQGIRLQHIDVGGGLGITYTDETPPEAGVLVAQLLARIDSRGHGHRKVLFEPGRSLVGNAGVLLGEVLYLKPGDEKNFCIVDAAMNDLARPAMYEAWMAIVPCRTRTTPPLTWDVVGPVCESGDWLGRDRPLAVQPGDRVAVLSAGAYGMSMASNYNTRPRAAEVLVSGAQAWLIRDREDPAALFAGEHLLPAV